MSDQLTSVLRQYLPWPPATIRDFAARCDAAECGAILHAAEMYPPGPHVATEVQLILSRRDKATIE